MHRANVRFFRISRVSSSMSDGAGSKVGLEEMLIDGMTLSDGRCLGVHASTRRYLKSALGVSDVALRAFELRSGRVILSGVYDAPEAMSPT